MATVVVLIGAFSPIPTRAAPNLPAAPAIALAQLQPDLIVRIYYRTPEDLALLAARHDLFESANHQEGWVEGRLTPGEYEGLQRAGYRIEIDAEQTALSRRRLDPGPAMAGIPGFECYRTVEETEATLLSMASTYPHLATLVDIGDSWDKTQPGGPAGFDLWVLRITSSALAGPKPRLLLMAEHHARELTTSEAALRFAEELLAGYGTDPESTWLLDYNEVHLLPMANPDGRKWAEQGHLWRKNTDNNDGCTTFPNYGTDLNRNCGFKWGGAGSSGAACDLTFRGPAAFSEPENQAIRDYVRSLFPDQRGPNDTDATPDTATGLVLSLHSYSQLVLYPWAWTPNSSPNRTALHALGCKFGFHNRYTVQSANALYVTTGSLDDWVYGELGVATFTFEMGTEFFQSCDFFQTNVYPRNRLALYYAVKACRQPYLDPSGPEVIQLSAGTVTNQAGPSILLNAVASDTRYAGAASLPPSQAVVAARYSVDQPSWVPGTLTYPMTASDGVFDSSGEGITATLSPAGWTPGRHIVFVEAQDASGRWGVPTAVFVWSAPAIALAGRIEPGTFVLEWPSRTNQTYRLLGTPDLAQPFVPVTSGLSATPPTNTYSLPRNGATNGFYRLEIQP